MSASEGSPRSEGLSRTKTCTEDRRRQHDHSNPAQAEPPARQRDQRHEWCRRGQPTQVGDRRPGSGEGAKLPAAEPLRHDLGRADVEDRGPEAGQRSSNERHKEGGGGSEQHLPNPGDDQEGGDRSAWAKGVGQDTRHGLHQGKGPEVQRGEEPELDRVQDECLPQIGDGHGRGQAREEGQQPADEEQPEAYPAIRQRPSDQSGREELRIGWGHGAIRLVACRAAPARRGTATHAATADAAMASAATANAI